jgi:hypothetical protein
MADLSKRFGKGRITGIANQVVNEIAYTVPEGKKAFVKAVTICNVNLTYESQFYITLGGVYVAWHHSLKPTDSITIPFLDHILESGEGIVVSRFGSAASNIDYYISGREVDVE